VCCSATSSGFSLFINCDNAGVFYVFYYFWLLKTDFFKNKVKIEAKQNKKHFKCEICDFSTRRKDNPKQHTNIVHLKMKNYQCTQCSNKFGHNAHLNKTENLFSPYPRSVSDINWYTWLKIAMSCYLQGKLAINCRPTAIRKLAILPAYGRLLIL
jgi:hypothetical protein